MFQECDTRINAMLDKQDAWSVAHNSKAETSKFQCLRLTQCANVIHEDFHRSQSSLTIKCVNSTKLLGVILDQELCWHQHFAYATHKGESLLFAINCLTRPSFGLLAQYVCRLYSAVVVLKVEYALPVWYTPLHCPSPTSHKHGSAQHTRTISKLQRLACKMITSAFKSSPLDMMELLANIPPVQLQLADTCYREALRLCSLPSSHPLHLHAL